MIASALKLQNAPKEALFSEPIGLLGAALVQRRDELSQNEFMDLLFQYSATLASLTSALVVEAVLTESQMSELMATIEEMEAMGKDIE